MIAALPADAPPPPAFLSETSRATAPSQLVSKVKPAQGKPHRFTYKRRLISLDGGKVLLRLWADPVVEVNPATLECEVLEWGIRLHHSEIGDVDRRMARRFLELFSKADAQSLSEREQADWLKLLDQVDYQSFCTERAAPHYVEGTLLRKMHKYSIEWHDGDVENVPVEVATPLRVLDEGDRFGAYIKRGREDAVRLIERVTVLPSDEPC